MRSIFLLLFELIFQAIKFISWPLFIHVLYSPNGIISYVIKIFFYFIQQLTTTLLQLRLRQIFYIILSLKFWCVILMCDNFLFFQLYFHLKLNARENRFRFWNNAIIVAYFRLNKICKFLVWKINGILSYYILSKLETKDYSIKCIAHQGEYCCATLIRRKWC